MLQMNAIALPAWRKRLVLVFGFLLGFVPGLANVSLAADSKSAPSPDPQNITGVWWLQSYVKHYRPMEGGELPFTPAGLERYRQNQAGFKSGKVVDIARKRCVVDGVPRVLGSPYPMQVVQTPGYTTMLYEINHVFRIVPMDQAQTDDPIPAMLGNPVGKWEGDTLVIDSVGFKTSIFLDDSGVPVSDKLHVVERIRKINGGKQLETIFTIDDPEIFTKPWSARVVYQWRPDVRLMEYFCGEPHRSVAHVKGAK